MKDIFKDTLFNHGILVCEEKPELEVAFATRFLLDKSFGVRITDGKNLVTKEMVPFVAYKLGEHVPEPFYRGFPESVKKLAPDQVLFDQLFHYFRTYGTGDFSEAGHSELEEQVERLVFNEKCEARLFVVLTEEEAALKLGDYAEDLLNSTRPLSDDQYAFLTDYIVSYSYSVSHCASKNLAIRLLVDLRNIEYAEFISMSDVIKLVDELNYRVYGQEDIKKLNLRNRDRKFITGVINHLFRSGSCDIRNCYEKKALWCGLLHHIHYKPIDEASAQFVQAMRSKGNYSVYSEFEQAMAAGDIHAAVNALRNGKGSGAVLRNLNYIVSRCETDEDVNYVVQQINSSNGIVLLQLLNEYSHYTNGGARTFRFTRHNKLVVHTEDFIEEINRRSVISASNAEKLCSAIKDNLCKVFSGKLGKVFIDSAMEGIALPVQENTSSGGYGVLPRGSRIHIGQGKKIRAFTYWEKVNDIDLSVIGIRGDGSQVEFSWRSMRSIQSDAITYSGDQTSGYNGGSEYFDIDVEKFRKKYPDIEYLVFCDNVFSNKEFSHCDCRAGYMLRDKKDSGRVFEPKTVKTSFTIDCDSTFAYLFAIDLAANDFIWLNISRDSSSHVAGDTELGFLTSYFTLSIDMKEFFTMLATEVVSSAEDADVIVSDKISAVSESQELIHSSDFERITALMNS